MPPHDVVGYGPIVRRDPGPTAEASRAGLPVVSPTQSRGTRACKDGLLDQPSGSIERPPDPGLAASIEREPTILSVPSG